LRVLFILISVVFAAVSPTQALLITYVGQEDNVEAWRSTSVPKAYDPTDAGYYGAEGYMMYAVGNVANGWTWANPVTYASTVKSIPAYVTVANNGMDMTAWSAYAPGNWYPEIDDPTLAPAPTVANVSSGLGTRSWVYPAEASALDMTFGVGVPIQGLRVGIMARGQGNDQVASIRLLQTAGSGGGDATMIPVNGAATYFAFFDITGAQPGDTVTLLMKSDAGGNDHIYHHGISFDQIPEPSTASLLLLAGAVVAGRRLRRR
jgi:hypothetical protein